MSVILRLKAASIYTLCILKLLLLYLKISMHLQYPITTHLYTLMIMRELLEAALSRRMTDILT
jgi:hypothetical protein